MLKFNQCFKPFARLFHCEQWLYSTKSNILWEKPFWSKQLEQEEKSSEVAKVTVSFQGPPSTITVPALLLSLWAGYLVFLTPWVRAVQLPLISTNGNEMSQPSPSSTRVRDGAMSNHDYHGSLVSVNHWHITRVICLICLSHSRFSGSSLVEIYLISV